MTTNYSRYSNQLDYEVVAIKQREATTESSVISPVSIASIIMLAATLVVSAVVVFLQ